jgi:hypothetical protein
MPQSTDHGIEGNRNDGNENNACGNGGGGGEDGGGGNLGPIALVTPLRMIRRGGVALSNSAPAPIEITPGRAPCGGKETWTGTADVVLGVEVPLFWDSPKAAKLFGFSYQDGDDVHKGVQDIVTSLTRAQQSHDGYKHFVANIDRAPLTPRICWRGNPIFLGSRKGYVSLLSSCIK